jgi:hypothetical protein
MMEAGTHAFGDRIFESDALPSAANSTASEDHLVAQIEAAGGALSWMSYQEGLDAETGACPVRAAGHYHPRHDPFVFFRDVAGDPPSAATAAGAAHHRPMTALAPDLEAGVAASYTFITPDLCHDMHGADDCPSPDTIAAGDAWLREAMPPLLDFAAANAGVVFITWDEGRSTAELPFLALGPAIVPGGASDVRYSHASLVRSVERLLGLVELPSVASANDLGDLFVDGATR